MEMLALLRQVAYDFLKRIEDIEQAGILCRIPNWWKRKAAGVTLEASLGDEKPSMLGFDTLVSMRPKLVVDGVPLAREDIEMLLAQTDGLAFLKGKWNGFRFSQIHQKRRKPCSIRDRLPHVRRCFSRTEFQSQSLQTGRKRRKNLPRRWTPPG